MFTSGRSRSPHTMRPPPLRPERASLNTPPPSPPPVAPRPRPSQGRILAWSIGLSVAVHLLILLLSPSFLRIGLPPGAAGEDSDRFARREIVAIQPVISESAPDGAEDEDDLTRLPVSPSATRSPSAATPRAGAEPPAGATTEPAGPGADGSAREGLRSGPRDPRLWVNPRDVPVPEQSDRERYQAHIQARIDAINDSIQGDAERARRATDWTVKDAEGRRWGLSPEGVHLGGVTIPPALVPRPAPTGDNQTLERQREEQRQRDEIRRQEEARERRRQSGGDP